MDIRKTRDRALSEIYSFDIFYDKYSPNTLQIQIKANNGFKRIFRFIISLKTDQIGFVISNFSFNISKSSISSDGTDKCVATSIIEKEAKNNYPG